MHPALRKGPLFTKKTRSHFISCLRACLSYDYLEFVLGSTYDSDLQRAKISRSDIVSQ